MASSIMIKSAMALPSIGKNLICRSPKTLGGLSFSNSRTSIKYVPNARHLPAIRMSSTASGQSEPEETQKSESKGEVAPSEERGMTSGGGGRSGLLATPFGSTFADLWHPWMPSRSMRQMLQMVDKVFEDFTSGPMAGPLSRMGEESPLRTLTRPPWDVQETEQDFKLRIDMPGLQKDEVKINIEDGNILCIRGEHKEEKSEGEKWRSSRYGNYQTRVELPDNAKVEEIKAQLEHGVLRISVPKAPMEESQKMIEIPVE